MFVAGFIGSPAMNFLQADSAGTSVQVCGKHVCDADLASGKLQLGIRPEHLTLNDHGALTGTVSVFEHLGGESFVHLTLPDDQTLVAKLDGEHSFTPGEMCTLAIKPAHCHVFDMQGQKID